MKEIMKLLDDDKIKINWNKNPIRMDLFLSFLTIPYTKSTDHLGYHTGWTQYENKESKLIVTGGGVNGVEWLDHIQYGTKLANQYNNYVNPFYLFDIMTDEGKQFFIKYYEDDIKKIIAKADEEVEYAQSRLKRAIGYQTELMVEYNQLLHPINPQH